MTRTSSPKDLIAVLSTAVAILAEEMNVVGVSAARTAAARRRQARMLAGLSEDAAALSAACDVLMRRRELFD